MAIPVAIFDRDIMPNPEGLEKRDYGQCAIRTDGESTVSLSLSLGVMDDVFVCVLNATGCFAIGVI